MNNIKKLRQERNIKQADLAARLGVAQGTLSYWEQGKYDIDNKSLLKLSDYFGVSTDFLLGKTDDYTYISKELAVPGILNTVRIAFDRDEFDDLTQGEVDALAKIAEELKALRRM